MGICFKATAEVIFISMFISKAGTRPGNQPRCFRSITLTSFIFITKEKVAKMVCLARNTLHFIQYYYQEDKSIETAIYNLISLIENILRQNEFAFLDIEEWLRGNRKFIPDIKKKFELKAAISDIENHAWQAFRNNKKEYLYDPL